MIGSLKIQEKHSFVDPKNEEADKEDYINDGRNDRAAVLNVYQFHNYHPLCMSLRPIQARMALYTGPKLANNMIQNGPASIQILKQFIPHPHPVLRFQLYVP